MTSFRLPTNPITVQPAMRMTYNGIDVGIFDPNGIEGIEEGDLPVNEYRLYLAGSALKSGVAGIFAEGLDASKVDVGLLRDLEKSAARNAARVYASAAGALKYSILGGRTSVKKSGLSLDGADIIQKGSSFINPSPKTFAEAVKVSEDLIDAAGAVEDAVNDIQKGFPSDHRRLMEAMQLGKNSSTIAAQAGNVFRAEYNADGVFDRERFMNVTRMRTRFLEGAMSIAGGLKDVDQWLEFSDALLAARRDYYASSDIAWVLGENKYVKTANKMKRASIDMLAFKAQLLKDKVAAAYGSIKPQAEDAGASIQAAKDLTKRLYGTLMGLASHQRQFMNLDGALENYKAAYELASRLKELEIEAAFALGKFDNALSAILSARQTMQLDPVYAANLAATYPGYPSKSPYYDAVKHSSALLQEKAPARAVELRIEGCFNDGDLLDRDDYVVRALNEFSSGRNNGSYSQGAPLKFMLGLIAQRTRRTNAGADSAYTPLKRAIDKHLLGNTLYSTLADHYLIEAEAVFLSAQRDLQGVLEGELSAFDRTLATKKLGEVEHMLGQTRRFLEGFRKTA